MGKKEIIDQTEAFIKQKLLGETTGHDWWHVNRVRKMAVFIGKKKA
jgi:uncharacterized protein